MEPKTFPTPDEKIHLFLQQQKVATIACTDAGHSPHCFNCYYVYAPDEFLLLFKSSPGTRHMLNMNLHPVIAGTILPDKLNAMFTRGIQLTGTLLPAEQAVEMDAAEIYHRQLPFARVMQGEVSVIRLDTIKMTDSSLGFGKKVYWQRSAAPVAAS